ncbi:hypothetical protein DFH07DRAFT_774650 [Mycena maculata]|uniref:Uncharacterized protein n=1 Tax=Mycena maculata TaxID=230809 RepID=A0AAD7IY32_9AGAR|nr:hypothetical protein DFH07DRAFT_774650 [Mycena maculata]
MTPPSPTPILPPELEKEIFQIAASSGPLSIPRLMLVAWRVKTWVEPMLYRVLVILGGTGGPRGLNGMRGYPFEDDEEFSRIQSIPTSILTESVRHLFLSGMPDPVTEFILSASSGVEDFFYLNFQQHNPSILDVLGRLSLKRLYCGISTDIFESVAQVDFSHALFSHITHLELFDQLDVDDTDIWSNLALIPHLTHLALNCLSVSLALTLLETCNLLRVLVFMRSSFDDDDESELGKLARDSRFVQTDCAEFIKDWQMGALTGIDYWSRAEDFIMKRMSGEVDRFQYVMKYDESTTLR